MGMWCRSAATIPRNRTRRRISLSVKHARVFGVVESGLGTGMEDLLRLVGTGLAERRRRGSVEHSRNVGLVAGPGANAAACRGMYGVKVLELHSVEGVMDSLTERNKGGASSGELEHLSEDFRFELPAIAPVLKEVHEGDRGGIDSAGAACGVQPVRSRRIGWPDPGWPSTLASWIEGRTQHSAGGWRRRWNIATRTSPGAGSGKGRASFWQCCPELQRMRFTRHDYQTSQHRPTGVVCRCRRSGEALLCRCFGAATTDPRTCSPSTAKEPTSVWLSLGRSGRLHHTFERLPHLCRTAQTLITPENCPHCAGITSGAQMA